MLFLSSDRKMHEEKGVKLCLDREETFWKSITVSMESHYYHAQAYNVLVLTIFCLRIFLWSDCENITWNKTIRERQASLMEKVKYVVF